MDYQFQRLDLEFSFTSRPEGVYELQEEDPFLCLISFLSSRSRVKRLMGLTRTDYIDKINLNPGALGAEETRQSIPNLAVKLCCGDNTAGGALWEDSSAPGTCRGPYLLRFSDERRPYKP